ncbi:hypothetical protein SAMN05444416_11724 [Thermoactinomyces sp. DSM 45892]|nr:hypothetical protein SAMN05444416_11724 [Thermoactinomyces sp. DSM 45892]
MVFALYTGDWIGLSKLHMYYSETNIIMGLGEPNQLIIQTSTENMKLQHLMVSAK